MINNRKGVVMLLIISLILMLLILGGAVLMVSTGHFGTSHNLVERTRAYYAAEAAMQHVLWGCRTGATGYDLEGITAGGSITPATITVTDPNYSRNANIIIYAEGEQGAPADTHRIDITVVY